MTPAAETAWGLLPDRTKTLLLNNVWCGACGVTCTIVNYKGRVVGGDLVLEGECERCGGEVARVIEGS